MRNDGAAFGIDGRRIVAAGDSAGGQMAASLAMYLRDRSLPQLAGQVLIYPVLGTDLDNRIICDATPTRPASPGRR